MTEFKTERVEVSGPMFRAHVASFDVPQRAALDRLYGAGWRYDLANDRFWITRVRPIDAE